MQRHMKNSFAFYLIALFAALAFMSVRCPAAEAPWERRYKIKPEQTAPEAEKALRQG